MSKAGSGLFCRLPPAQPPWQPVCAISWWWGPCSAAPSEPRGGGDGPRAMPGLACGPSSPRGGGHGLRLWLGPGQAAAEGAARAGDGGPNPAWVSCRAPIPHPGAPCQELCLPGTPSPACTRPDLPAPLCCLLPRYMGLRCHRPPHGTSQHPQLWWHRVTATPLPCVPPRQETPRQPPKDKAAGTGLLPAWLGPNPVG